MSDLSKILRSPAAAVLWDVWEERQRQDTRWGEQNHPVFFEHPYRERSKHQKFADLWKSINARRVADANGRGLSRDRNCSWDGIIIEELHEALAEADERAARKEWVQVAAVAVNIIEYLDRKISASNLGAGDLDHEPEQLELDLNWDAR